MQQISLAHTGRSTSRLGYGCSSLMGAMDRRQSLGLLQTAYDSGIRHFDVAPMYGYGEAEGCLGDFVAQHRDVTLATKFGLLPARNQPLVRATRRLAGKLLHRLPALKQRLAPSSDVVSGGGQRARFGASSACLSLENSLRNLRSDHIDLWLLHEVEATDLSDDALLRFLQDAEASGKIGSFGVGSEAANIPQLLAWRPAYCPVVQFEWSLFDTQIKPSSSFRIHHRSLSAKFRSLLQQFKENAEVQNDWSTQVGCDLGSPDALAALMLKASLEMNPDSIILFSAKTGGKINANVSTEDDAALAAPALRLHDLIRAHEGLEQQVLRS